MFGPASIAGLEIKNRLVMAPIGTRLTNEVGGVDRRMIDFYAERAKGGVGTIIVEGTCVDYPLAVASAKNLRIYHNAYIGGHAELVEAVHAHGTKIILQLLHVGRNRRPIDEIQPVAPSAIPCKAFGVTPKELTISEIENIIQKFVDAAIRAKTAAYDGIELHGAHGYLIAQFMSSSSNHRKDRYGGRLINRMAFPLEIIRGIHQALGSTYPIFFRLSADEFVDGGMNIETSIRISKILEDAGVNAIDVSAGTYDSLPTMIEPMSYAEGWKINLAEAIKKNVKIPVIGVSVIRKPEFAESILRERKVDFAALGRALVADPFWPQKAARGREEEIIPCISCNRCLERISSDLPIRCTVNPLTGREQLRNTVLPVDKKKKIFVIGGGPAGMTAALTAGNRGHQVFIYEKAKHLGGQLLLAAKPPGKEKLTLFCDYLKNQIEEKEIEVNFGRDVNCEDIVQSNADAVIIATGAIPAIPNIAGTRSGLENGSVCTAWDVLEGKKTIKDRTVLIAGGGSVGCETALFLADRNIKIIIAEVLNGLALDMDPINRLDLVSEINKRQITVMLNRKVDRVDHDRILLVDNEMNDELVQADLIVLALGVVPIIDLANDLKDKVQEIYVVGDCNRPRKLSEAVYEGFLAGERL
jgi:2,4-dienoyl-CoA reductase-like NADH-dependent reductase (Old Yellow Enzyme family)/thioredoxin reductase